MSAPYYSDEQVTLWHGDALAVLRELPDASVDCCVTSPPYFGLRDYGVNGQIGAEASPAEFVEALTAVFREVRRVLADDGTLWLNIGDSYSGGNRQSFDAVGGKTGGRGINAHRAASGLPGKNLLGIPWRVAFALQGDGWILRNDIIWAKPNAMPESIQDRLSTKHEHVFLLAKSPRYWFDLDPIREPHESTAQMAHRAKVPPTRGKTAWAAGIGIGQSPRDSNGGVGFSDGGRNPGDVWSIPTQPFRGAHFAVFPQALPERCILAGCKPGGTVLDPFSGSGTTGLAATKHGRRYVGIDLNAEYLDLSLRTRLRERTLDFGEATA